MSKGQSPLLGYNTNVRHRGKVFHIQTEDSGVGHPHVITHLFADGGRILKSTKTAYAELLEAPDMKERVKKVMQDQHKAMFIALRDGQFDTMFEPGELAPPTAAGGGSTSRSSAALPAQRPSSAGITASRPVAVAATGDAPAAAVEEPPASATLPAASRRVPVGTPATSTPLRRPSQPGIPAVDPPAATSPTVAGTPPLAAAPPSPPAPSPPSSPAEGPRADASGSSAAAVRSGRYAPVRAPEVLGSFRHKNDSASIFGEDLMSEKSLDEVILAYLAEDLDDKK